MAALRDLAPAAAIAAVAVAVTLGARQDGAGRPRLPWEPPEGRGALAASCALAAAIGAGRC